MKILFVDNSEGAGKLFDVLTGLGYRAAMAANGEEALEFLKRNSVNLLITGPRIPGMQGDELARRARKVVPGLPVIMITDSPSLLHWKTVYADDGVGAVLRNRFADKELAAAIRKVLP